MDAKEIEKWVTLDACPKFGCKQFLELHSKLSRPLQIFSFSQKQLQDFHFSNSQIQFLLNPDKQRITDLVQWIIDNQVELVVYGSKRYPKQLMNIARPPMILYCLGDTALLNRFQIAFVGSRNPTTYGVQVTQNLVSDLTVYNAAIVSGLAIGIDGIAHKSALKNGAKTIAVLGSGLQHIYPKRHYQLAIEIVNQGLLISEFLPDIAPIQFNFPRRNRIISGLSKGVVVIEAAIKSGSLITAREALEQGRDVFAVPGNIFNCLSKGCHYLIQQGAKLVTQVDDIIEEYDVVFTTEKIAAKNEQKKCLAGSNLLASVEHDVTPIDVIVHRSGLPVEQVLRELMVLEVEGAVISVSGGYIKAS